MNPVRSVERAISILFLVSQSDEALNLTEIARRCQLDKATALRLLSTLEKAKLVQRDPQSRRYGLGPAVWRLTNTGRNDLNAIARPYMELLRRTTKETVTLVCPRGLERVVLEVLPAPNELSVVSMVGTAQPIYAGASGKVFMAFMDAMERERIIQSTGLRPVNPIGETDRESFLDVLEAVRRTGYAYSIGDVTPGASALAAPIHDKDGKMVACVVLRGPEFRMPAERMEQLAPGLMRAADDISKELGYRMELRKSA